MKQLFLIILIFSTFQLSAQVGIKAGYTSTRGYHAGLTFDKYLFKDKGLAAGAEVLFQNKSLNYLQYRFVYRSAMQDSMITEVKRAVMYYIQIPVYLKKTFTTENNIKPYLLAGAAPSFGITKEADNFYLSALLAAGVNIKHFRFEGRYDLGFTRNFNSNNIMASVGYTF